LLGAIELRAERLRGYLRAVNPEVFVKPPLVRAGERDADRSELYLAFNISSSFASTSALL